MLALFLFTTKTYIKDTYWNHMGNLYTSNCIKYNILEYLNFFVLSGARDLSIYIRIIVITRFGIKSNVGIKCVHRRMFSDTCCNFKNIYIVHEAHYTNDDRLPI